MAGDNLDRLVEFDIHVQLVARQPRLAKGARKPDLVCRLTQPVGKAREGDLLVIENKATPVGSGRGTSSTSTPTS
jgi:hypothetical protein